MSSSRNNLLIQWWKWRVCVFFRVFRRMKSVDEDISTLFKMSLSNTSVARLVEHVTHIQTPCRVPGFEPDLWRVISQAAPPREIKHSFKRSLVDWTALQRPDEHEGWETCWKEGTHFLFLSSGTVVSCHALDWKHWPALVILESSQQRNISCLN